MKQLHPTIKHYFFVHRRIAAGELLDDFSLFLNGTACGCWSRILHSKFNLRRSNRNLGFQEIAIRLERNIMQEATLLRLELSFMKICSFALNTQKKQSRGGNMREKFLNRLAKIYVKGESRCISSYVCDLVFIERGFVANFLRTTTMWYDLLLLITDMIAMFITAS